MASRPPGKPAARSSSSSRPTSARQPAARTDAARKPAARKPATSTRTPAASTRAAKDRRALGKVDGPRGQRDGRQRDARKKQARVRRRIAGLVVSSVLVVGVLFAAGFPLHTYLQQRSDSAKAAAELEQVKAERKAINDERTRLDSPEGVEQRARDLGYVKPGEQAYNILPGKTDPLGLPDGWPFTGVEDVLRGR